MNSKTPSSDLNTYHGLEACSIFPVGSVVADTFTISQISGKLEFTRAMSASGTSAELLFPNKFAQFRGQLPENILPLDMIAFRKGEGLKLLVEESTLTPEQQELFQKIKWEVNSTRRISTGIIDTYLDEKGNPFWIATYRSAGSGMGSDYQVTLSGGGFHGNDLIEGCVREMTEEGPVLLKALDGSIKLGLPRIAGYDHVAIEGLKNGIHEFLEQKLTKFISEIETDPLYRADFSKNFWIEAHELAGFLETSLADLEKNIVWLDTEIDDSLCNTNVSLEGVTHKLWVGDETSTTRSYEVRLPVTIKLPSGYTFAGAKPRLYLESTLQKPVRIDYRDHQGLVYDNPEAKPVDTLREIGRSILVQQIMKQVKHRVSLSITAAV